MKELIKEGESETLEFKRSLLLKDEIGEAISAFSNARGGTIVVGVSDSGNITGVDMGENTIEELANYIKRNTDNHVFPSIRPEKVGNKDIVVIDISESTEKPVFFKGRTYKRVGKSKHRLSASEIRALARESSKSYWDEQACEGATLEDIDWNFVEDFFVPRYESISDVRVEGDSKSLLSATGCLKDNKPTNAGILLFGKNPQKFFINSYIALARYKRKEVGTERLDYKEFKGNLFEQVDNCDRYIKEQIAVMSQLLPYKVEREDIPEYGLFSLRELITNALTHRDYADQRSKVIIKMFDNRIEYYNPGGLPEEITPLNIAEKQFSRNPTIANVLAKVRYIEELGEGWDKIIKEHKEHPLKPETPLINSDGYTMLVTIYSTKEKFEKKEIVPLNERQRKALEYLSEYGRMSNKEYRGLFPGITDKTAYRDLQDMVKKGLIKSIGERKGRYYVRG